ncbi:MAG TPA: M23 family metallopeptidase [Gemmatimonadales bacterium]|nr:M23 family metallopeptidase [Gemmatimonadales bacterium]
MKLGGSLVLLGTLLASPLAAQGKLPPLPDSTGWGVHVLTLARDPSGGIWAGTYGHGIFVLPAGGLAWRQIRSDSAPESLSWDFVHAIAFGTQGEVWYGTVGNGWGVSRDGGHTWQNWTLRELGPEWQYVAPAGIVVRGASTWIGTADGLQLTTDGGWHWTAFVDGTGAAARGPADSALTVLPNEYVRRISRSRTGILLSTLRGSVALTMSPDGAVSLTQRGYAGFPPLARLGNWRGTLCGIREVNDTTPCYEREGRLARAGEPPAVPKTTWFQRPISLADNSYIDQTYRYGSTMGGNFQPHQGVEFNNPDGTPVHAIGSGTVVYAGPAEAGALTVAIRHDSILPAAGANYLFSVYYHNSAILVEVGQRVTAGQVISEVGNTGRATNDHLHLEVHAAPTEDVGVIVDSLQRYPAFTTNPELWIDPLPGTGIVAGQVFDGAGRAVEQARIYGIIKPEPAETPYSFAETYGPRNHPHPLYGEHFAVSDVPPGTYLLGTEIDGRKVFRRVTVEEGKLTWVVFRP